MTEREAAAAIRRERWVEDYKRAHPDAGEWAAGYGAIEHSIETQAQVFALADMLASRGVKGDGMPFFGVLAAADRLANAAMWLVVHETYAKNVYLDGRDLGPDDFKPDPQGHTGGALNMVPAYVGYLTANVLCGITRSWVMGQGHTVAAIDSVNLLVGNMTKKHAERYSVTDEGLTRYVRDFYSYRLNEHGEQDSPLGSHVNINTAGGMVEGGYLGFTELQYVHMPLRGEHLVVFLSDGAFEEQRGSDWAPRWWRAFDSGLVTPIMINNGRRIDQRTTMAQEGGVEWFVEHLRLNHFDPMVFDGSDPAAFAWAIIEMEERLAASGTAVDQGRGHYPVWLPYGIAVAPKGAGFYGAGTNLAHNLPLPGNPHNEPEIAHLFNSSARRLWVPEHEMDDAIATMSHHEGSRRPPEREHPIANRHVRLQNHPPLTYHPAPESLADTSAWRRLSPMSAVDEAFAVIVGENLHLRPRVGNPDEMRSNRMLRTLDQLKFRVTAPEEGLPEALDGAVITALNEEAVISAPLANKGGINITVTYEAFGAKMFGNLRQEIIFTAHAKDAGYERGWLSVPLVLTSHTWENGKNEMSHQDPSMAESLLGERSDVSRVMFPADWNTAMVLMDGVYRSQGQYWTLVVPKTAVPALFSKEEASRLLQDGALRVDGAGHRADEANVIITAIGAFQLDEALRASRRLAERDVAHDVVYMLEPGRFRQPRAEGEAAHAAGRDITDALYPASVQRRVFVTHTRPEPLLGVLTPLHTGAQTRGLGFIDHGGTLDVQGMLFVNRSTWAHIVEAVAQLVERPLEDLLTEEEHEALAHRRNPQGVIV